MFNRVAAFKAGVVFLAIAPDPQFKPVGQRVDHRNTNPVQTARDLVGVLVEFTARMKLGHDDFGRRDPFFGMEIDRNSTPVVAHGYAGILVNRDRHGIGVTRQGLIDPVVHDLIDHVVQTRAVIRVPDIHPGALSDRL